MGRAYGQTPCAVLGLELPETTRLLIDAFAHELGARQLAQLKGFPNIDLGTI